MTTESEQGAGEMRVIVITHADAKYREHMPEPRPLTELGRKQSQWAAKRLKQRGNTAPADERHDNVDAIG